MSSAKLNQQPVRVLYIGGLYRSGSTILDIILGNHPEFVSVGELRNLPAIALSDATTCACGEVAAACEFWGPVLARWRRSVGPDGLDRLRRLQDRFERIRSLPRLVREHVWGSDAFSTYGRLLEKLYFSIKQESGKNVIVDSSKYPARAYALSRLSGIDLRLVHLVRDGRAVLWSCLRKPNTEIAGSCEREREIARTRATARSWIAVNLLTDLVRRTGNCRSTRVRYEDFVTPPYSALQAVGSVTGYDLNVLTSSLSGNQGFNVGHLISGNRVRGNDSVKIRADFAWTEDLPAERRDEFWRRTGWLARFYGYS